MKTSLLASNQILRIESLGDNCELGFVLRNLGSDAGSLFRWTRTKPEQLLTTLRANFAGMYEFPNLEPLRDGMVVDAKYGVEWHSDMKSAEVNGRRIFLLDEAKRRKMYSVEIHKIRYLRAKFVARARLGGLIFVVKSNAGISEQTVDDIFEALSDLALGARFALLEVQASSDPALVGTVAQRRAGFLRGYVSQFASYDDAIPRAMDAWASVLDAALGLLPCPDWSMRLTEFHPTKARINLVFPLGRSQDLSKPIFGDLRAGAAVLLHGNTWCRQIGDSFRLHGADPADPPALLRWLAVHAPSACELHGTLFCPVEDSIPVNVVVTVRDENEAVIGEWRSIIAPNEPDTIALSFTPAGNQPVSIELAAHASRSMKSGERAVIDISPLSLNPVDPTALRAQKDHASSLETGSANLMRQIAS